MIQRIQTLYFLASLALLATLFFVPYATVLNATQSADFFVYGVKETAIDNGNTSFMSASYCVILLALATLIQLLVTFGYRHRMFQIRMSLANIVVQLGLLGFMVYYSFQASALAGGVGGMVTYSIAMAFVPVSIILVYLGYRGVVKDEALVRSLDRIR